MQGTHVVGSETNVAENVAISTQHSITKVKNYTNSPNQIHLLSQKEERGVQKRYYEEEEEEEEEREQNAQSKFTQKNYLKKSNTSGWLLAGWRPICPHTMP